jgi:hypothetical protein
MHKFVLAVMLLSILTILLSTCGSKSADPASRAVDDYLNALVNKDANKLSALSCADWESNALLELDSFQAVKTRLVGLTCRTAAVDGASSQVNCQGEILATYNGEDQAFDLSKRNYEVLHQGGEYLVCGYK